MKAKPAAEALKCAECGEALDQQSVHADCHDCGDQDDDAPEVVSAAVASEVRDWTLRAKTLGRITPDVARALEDCADALEAGE